MKMKLLSGLVLLFAAFLFCENALACSVDPKWQGLMDNGKYSEAFSYVDTNSAEIIKVYSPFCLGYFGAEANYKLGELESAVFIMKATIKAVPDSHQTNPYESHKAVHWAIELAEKDFAENKLDEAIEAAEWAIARGNFPSGECCYSYGGSQDHAARIAELRGDLYLKKGNSKFALIYYQVLKISTYSPEINNKIAFAKGEKPDYKLPARNYSQPIPTCHRVSLVPVSFEMVKIPAGSFKMGGSPEKRKWATGEFYDWQSINPDEKLRKSQEPEHKVTISKDFYLGKYEVTQAQWKAVMGSLPKSCDYVGFDVVGDDKPIVCVSWDDVQVYIKMLNARGNGTYRLPTEAEWEYAARGGTSSTYFWGNDEKDACKYGNVADESGYGKLYRIHYKVKCNDGYKHASPVGKFLPNPFGLYDMSGNVGEMCQDFYGDYQKENQIDPTGPSSSNSHVRRGGDWDDKYFSPGFHSGYPHYLGSNDTGFRLVKEN